MQRGTGWYQQSLLGTEVVELRLRLGVISERNHAQAMVELLDPTTGVLIAAWSNPHGDADSWHDLLEVAVHKAHQYLGDAIDPF